MADTISPLRAAGSMPGATLKDIDMTTERLMVSFVLHASDDPASEWLSHSD